MDEPVTLVRDELFRRVWSTPMRTLAQEYGISDVALAKICKKMDIPVPGLGYWARVAHGQKPKQAKLPKAKATIRVEYTLQPRFEAKPATPRVARPLPDVPLASEFQAREAHDAVKRLAAALKAQHVDRDDGQQRLKGSSGFMIRLSPAIQPRALLILDGVAKVLALRGHEVRFTEPPERYLPCTLAVHLSSVEVDLQLVEPLVKSSHQRTPEEEASFKKYGYTFARTIDLTPSGRLVLTVGSTYGGQKWSDTAHRTLEAQLGKVILAVEDAAEQKVTARLEAEERAIQEREEQHRRDVQQVKANYQHALVEDLDEMVARFERARAIRAFLHALEVAVPHQERTAKFAEWVEWAEARAAELDPLTDPQSVAKVVKLDFSRLSNQQFEGWLRRVPGGSAR